MEEEQNKGFSIKREFAVKKNKNISNEEEREMISYILQNKIKREHACLHMNYYLNKQEGDLDNLFIYDDSSNEYGIKIPNTESYLEIFNCPICGKNLSER